MLIGWNAHGAPFFLVPREPSLSLEEGAPLQGEPLNEARLRNGNRAAQLSITAISSIIQS